MAKQPAENPAVVLTPDLDQPVTMAAFNGPGTRFAVTHWNANRVLIFDPHTGQEVGRVKKLNNVRGVNFLSPDVVLVVADGVCWRHDLRTGRRALLWQEKGKWAYGTTLVSPDGRVVAIGSHNCLDLYDVARGRVRHRFHTEFADIPYARGFSADGRRVAVELHLEALHDRLLVVWDVKTGKRLRTYEVRYILGLTLRGDTLAVTDPDRSFNGSLCLFDLREGEDPVAEYKGLWGQALRFGEDERTFELLGDDGSMTRLRRGRSRVVFRANPPDRWDYAENKWVSPDWSLLAGALEDRVLVWRGPGPSAAP
jgi:WD40 repeat protein